MIYMAYRLYTYTNLYKRRREIGDAIYCQQLYEKHNIDFFVGQAIKNFWFYIIFTPWTIKPHEDFFVYGRHLNENS